MLMTCSDLAMKNKWWMVHVVSSTISREQYRENWCKCKFHSLFFHNFSVRKFVRICYIQRNQHTIAKSYMIGCDVIIESQYDQTDCLRRFWSKLWVCEHRDPNKNTTGLPIIIIYYVTCCNEYNERKPVPKRFEFSSNYSQIFEEGYFKHISISFLTLLF